jgi:hypothetical protein
MTVEKRSQKATLKRRVSTWNARRRGCNVSDATVAANSSIRTDARSGSMWLVELRQKSVAGVRVTRVGRAPLLAALLVLATVGGLLWNSPTRAEATTCVIDGLNRMCDPGYGVDSFTYDGRPHQFAIAADHSVYHRWA